MQLCGAPVRAQSSALTASQTFLGGDCPYLLPTAYGRCLTSNLANKVIMTWLLTWLLSNLAIRQARNAKLDRDRQVRQGQVMITTVRS